LPPSKNREDVGQLLINFFNYFGHIFDWRTHAICVRLNRRGAAIDTFSLANTTQPEMWYIEDPFDLKHDLAGQCSLDGRRRILEEMKRACHVLSTSGSWRVVCPGGGPEQHVLKQDTEPSKMNSPEAEAPAAIPGQTHSFGDGGQLKEGGAMARTACPAEALQDPALEPRPCPFLDCRLTPPQNTDSKEAEGQQRPPPGLDHCSDASVNIEATPEQEAPQPLLPTFLDCLLGPKQQQKALRERVAARYWAGRWEEQLLTNPDWFELERAEMKQVFDNFQVSEMRADTEKKTPKAHFSAVMRALNRSGRVQLPKNGPAVFKEDAADADPVESLEPPGPEGGEPKRKRIPIPLLRKWADRWEKYCNKHPDLPGSEREAMKAGFDEVQEEHVSEQGKVHFSAVMSFLRLSGRHSVGTWKGYNKNGQYGSAGASENEVEQFVSISAGHLSEMEAVAAATFTGDINFLGEKFGLGVVEVQWEEDRLMLMGSAVAVYKARLELVEMLRFYFPDEEIDIPEPPEGMPTEGEADGDPSQPHDPQHWSESIECSLSAAQRKRTLDKTQEMRERQRVAVKHWADRWEEWVKVHPELVGAEREVMKTGFDEMQTAETGTAAKAHFSLVMNFLRQSGRRGIGAWKDYTPKSWPT